MTDITENGKYYRPEFKDLRIGMEVESLYEGANYEQGWEKCEIINCAYDEMAAVINRKIQISDIQTMRNLERIRVKHLDHDDIVEAGWECMIRVNASDWFQKDYQDVRGEYNKIDLLLAA